MMVMITMSLTTLAYGVNQSSLKVVLFTATFAAQKTAQNVLTQTHKRSKRRTK